MTKIIIVGAGCAGVEAAFAARSQNEECEITLLSAETVLPYRRPALSRFVATDLSDTELYMKDTQAYSEAGITLRLDCPVTSIDRTAQTVALKSGEILCYDKLLLATGANPFRPPLENSTPANTAVLRTIADAYAIRKAIHQPDCRNVVVLGGGLLGLELADSLLASGKQVTVIECADRLLPRQLNHKGSRLLETQLAEVANLKILFGRSIQSVEGGNEISAILLSDGTRLPTDYLILSAGACSETTLAEQCNLPLNRGIITNASMQTEDPAIFAAGDAARPDGFQIGLWMAARDQGRVAGINMAGGNVLFTPGCYPARLSAFGIKLFSLGNVTDNDVADIEEIGNDVYKRLFFHDDKLCGVLLIGAVGEAMKYQKLYLEQAEKSKVLS